MHLCICPNKNLSSTLTAFSTRQPELNGSFHPKKPQAGYQLSAPNDLLFHLLGRISSFYLDATTFEVLQPIFVKPSRVEVNAGEPEKQRTPMAGKLFVVIIFQNELTQMSLMKSYVAYSGLLLANQVKQ